MSINFNAAGCIRFDALEIDVDEVENEQEADVDKLTRAVLKNQSPKVEFEINKTNLFIVFEGKKFKETKVFKTWLPLLLCIAAQYDHEETCKILLNKEIDVNKTIDIPYGRDMIKSSPLLFAYINGNKDLAEELEKKGAKIPEGNQSSKILKNYKRLFCIEEQVSKNPLQKGRIRPTPSNSPSSPVRGL